MNGTDIEPKQAIEAKTNSVAMQALTLVIKDEKTFDQSTTMLEAIKGLKKEIVDFIKPIKEAANKAHKTACAQEKKLTEPLDEATDALKAGRLAYAKPAPPPAPVPAPPAADGPQPDAEGFMPLTAPPTPRPSATQAAAAKAQMQIREYWHAEVVDFMALVKGVAAGTYPAALLQANQKELNLMATALKNTGKIDGVSFIKTEGEAF